MYNAHHNHGHCALASLVLLAAFAAGCNALDQSLVTQTDSMSADGIVLLEVDAGSGDVEVIGDPDGSEIEVEARIGTTGVLRTRAAAERCYDIELVLDEGDTVSLDATGCHGLGGLYADLYITVPSDMAVRLVDGAGDVTIEDVGHLRVDDGAGDIFIRSVSGDVRVIDGSGDVEISAVDLDVDIVDGSGDIDVSGVGGCVSVEDGAGDITVSDVGEFVIVADGSGDVDGDW